MTQKPPMKIVSPRIVLAAVAILQLTACSKTVQWEEEVPLNTGETIWVRRSVTYARSSAYANPLKLGWKIQSETLVFNWAGQKYEWEGDIGLMVLAISPQHLPTLVADAGQYYEWGTRRGYKCVKPYYVQFVPKRPNDWSWPPTIESWLYGVEANLMGYRAAPDEMPTHVPSVLRKRVDADRLSRNPEAKQIVLDYIPSHCKGKV